MMYKSHVNSHQTHIQRAREGMQKKYHLEQEAPAHIVTQQLGEGEIFNNNKSASAITGSLIV